MVKNCDLPDPRLMLQNEEGRRWDYGEPQERIFGLDKLLAVPDPRMLQQRGSSATTPPATSSSNMFPQQYCLRWKYHHSNLQTMFSQLLERQAYCDVTLACEGKTLRAHKVNKDTFQHSLALPFLSRAATNLREFPRIHRFNVANYISRCMKLIGFETKTTLVKSFEFLVGKSETRGTVRSILRKTIYRFRRNSSIVYRKISNFCNLIG